MGGKRSWSNPGKNGQEKHRFGIHNRKMGKKDLAKTTPKKEKTRKREANKRSTANHLELQRKGLQEKIARENKE